MCIALDTLTSVYYHSSYTTKIKIPTQKKMLSLKKTSLLLSHEDSYSFINIISLNKGFFQKELVNLFRCKYNIKIYAK